MKARILGTPILSTPIHRRVSAHHRLPRSRSRRTGRTQTHYNAGSVLLPNSIRSATLGGNMDLRAQVHGAAVASYSWNTSGLTDATNIAGASSYDLTFQWDVSVQGPLLLPGCDPSRTAA